jgi:hypothetical protein
MTPLEEAVRKAATDVEAKRQIHQAALELRDDLIVKLYDTGCSVAHVARTALISVPRVMQIIGKRG